MRQIRNFIQTVNAALRHTLEAQLPAAVAGDPEAAKTHLEFVGRQLVIGLVGIAAFPVWLATGAGGALVAATAFICLLLAFVPVVMILRGSDLGVTERVSSLGLTVLVAWVVSLTGGSASPLVVLFALPAALAARGGRERCIRFALIAGLSGLAISFAATLSGLVGPAMAIQAFAGLALGALTTVVAARMVHPPKSRSEISAPATVAPDQFDTRVKDALETVGGFARMLSDERLVRADADCWRQQARMIRIAAENLEDALLEQPSPADDGPSDLQDRQPEIAGLDASFADRRRTAATFYSA